MFSYFELPEHFFKNDAAIRDCMATFPLSDLDLSTATIVPNEDLSMESIPDASFCIVRDGIIKVYSGTKLLYFLETGDVFLKDSLAAVNASLQSEFASAIDHCLISELTEKISANKTQLDAFIKVCSLINTQLHIVFDTSVREVLDVQPITRTFSPGEAIIIQDTTPTDVYTLLAGEADVYLRDTPVGKILVGEIFGAMSAATHLERSASVVAKTHCVVISLPKENFLGLARTHPETLFKLVEDMSRVILSLNQEIEKRNT